MKDILVVVDMQKDFIDGSLGTKEADKITANAAERIRAHEGEIFVTYDTHFDNYLETAEGKKLPVKHCIKGTPGWELDSRIAEALKTKKYTAVEKLTFGSTKLPGLIEELCGDEEKRITLIGLCTDICVVSNALILKANFPDSEISVDADCCAGVTPELHQSALAVMRSCQIDTV